MSFFTQRLAPRVAATAIIFMIALVGFVSLRVTAESDFRIQTAVERGRSMAHAESATRALASAAINLNAPLAILDVDRFDDPSPAASASACTVAPNDCSLRGSIIAANLAPGSTINLPAGTYTLTIAGTGEQFAATGDLDVRGNNTSIIGAGAGVSIIQQTVADRVFDVNPTLVAGFNFILSGVTVRGGNLASGSGAGILTGGPTNTVTLTNCAFSGNTARNNGGGISFSVNSVSSLTVIDCSFSNNTATVGVGGAINYSAAGTLLITRSTFSGNAASANSGGAINATSIATGGIFNISQTAFVNNQAGGTGRGGAISKTNGLLNVSYSRLVGNTAAVPANGHGISVLPGGTGSALVDDNWWGVNSGPGTNDVVGSTTNTWLQLRLSANPNAVCSGGTSTLNADIYGRNMGGPVLNCPGVGCSLNGLPAFPVPPATIFTASNGTISGASMQFVDGAASATYTATSGVGGASAQADNETVTVPIVIGGNATSDPADQTVCAGGTATFTTTATGSGPFTFVWKKGATVLNNGDLGGRVTITSDSSSSTLTITNVQASDADTYTVEATGACNTASQSATLTVNAPTTTSDPADQTVCQGAMANFSTTASGAGPFHYAWTLDGSPYNGDSASISVDTSSLSVGNHTVSVTTTGACSSDTQTATLIVQSAASTTDPADQTVCQGATANFSTTASGTGPFSYAWTVDGSPAGTDSPNLSVDTTSLSVGNHTVSVTTTGACGSATQSATLTVQATTTTSDPSDQTVCQGAPANFSTTASGTGPFHYAWTLDGSPYNGDSPSIIVDTTSMSVGNHTVSVTTTGSCGSATQTATLTVQATTTTTDPPDQTVCQGATATFSTTAGGTGPFHYAWTLDGLPYNGDSASISVNTTSLSQGTHTITVTTSGTCGSAMQSATLTIANAAPVITVGTPSISVWPPNHQYRTFNISDFNVTATSSCEGNITNRVVIASVTSDELDDNPGGADGNTINDMVIAADCKSVQLRQERDGGVDGRVYTITFRVTDSVGNTTTATAKVLVPINQNGGGAVDSGPQNVVIGTCP
jgi:immunoglobulin I-set domain protein